MFASRLNCENDLVNHVHTFVNAHTSVYQSF